MAPKTHFWSLGGHLGSFLEAWGVQGGPKIEKVKVWNHFWVILGSFWEAFGALFEVILASFFHVFFDVVFGGIWDHFWLHFGGILGSFW